jgi:putative transposase
MADDTNIIPAAETATTDASSKTKEKKTRAPRKPKAAVEAVADTSVSAPAKKTRGPGRKAAAPKETAAAAPAAKAPVPAKRAAALKAPPVKRAPQKTVATKVASDGFADLLKLEEENQTLRKALSDKLRAENADLRKKLGVA